MTTDLAIVYSPVGGGHKAAAMAIAEGARARGARAEVISLFDIAPRVSAMFICRLISLGKMPFPPFMAQLMPLQTIAAAHSSHYAIPSIEWRSGRSCSASMHSLPAP